MLTSVFQESLTASLGKLHTARAKWVPFDQNLWPGWNLNQPGLPIFAWPWFAQTLFACQRLESWKLCMQPLMLTPQTVHQPAWVVFLCMLGNRTQEPHPNQKCFSKTETLPSNIIYRREYNWSSDCCPLAVYPINYFPCSRVDGKFTQRPCLLS